MAASAQQGGRWRWTIAKEGCNRHQNGGWNLEHVDRSDPEDGTVEYLLRQLACLRVQRLERASLRRRLAAAAGRPLWKRFGRLTNVARRLRDRVRLLTGEESWFEARLAGKRRIQRGRS